MPHSTGHSTAPALAPPTLAAPADNSQRTAALALIIGTFCWGCGFTWAKGGGEAIHRTLALPNGALFGPIFLLAWRFTLAGFAWFALFPAARRGWTWGGVGRAMTVGVLLAGALVFQHLGLDRTSEAVSAFLTSLTILFVPLLMTIVMRKPPRAVLWLGVALATAGVWLMTGATPAGFGWGEVLGLACSFTYGVYILVVNAVVARDVPWRVTGGQFLVVAAMCFMACTLMPGGASHLRLAVQVQVLSQREVWQDLLLLAIFPTITAFGLLTHYQPRLDPTRAALLYLVEPVVAAAYAAVAVHHTPGRLAAVGAALILAANVLVELLSARAAREKPPMVID